jgi:hypothetical protein
MPGSPDFERHTGLREYPFVKISPISKLASPIGKPVMYKGAKTAKLAG